MNATIIRRWASPERILVATNVTDGPHLMPHAVAQARLNEAKVLLVHVIEPPNLQTNPAEGLPFVMPGPTLRSEQDQLNQMVRQFQQEGILCEPIVLKGLPQEQILGLIKERDVDRVITGTRSAEALERILVGSVAEELLHTVDVPICVIGPRVRPQVRPDQIPASILFATSLHHEPHLSAQLALVIAELNQSRLTLLHVIPARVPADDDLQQLQNRRKEELLSLVTGEAELWCSPVVTIREGDPAEEILAEAKSMAADMIILGATGASRLSRLLAAGVVHRVIAEAKAPVVTLR